MRGGGRAAGEFTAGAREKKKEEDPRRLHITANRCSAVAAVAGRKRGDSMANVGTPPPPLFFSAMYLYIQSQ